MRTHIFIVNDQTFPIHLKYLFAGTGSKEKDEDISLLADIKRVRPGDFVIFYIEGTTRVKGGFYGIFKIAEKFPVVFHTPGKSGYLPDLEKKLIYRTLIEPYEVYDVGVPEWEALDKLPVYATEVQWSLIYRKLKGRRGCTPLLPWEAERLINLIRNKSSGRPIADEKYMGGFDWDNLLRKIILTENRQNYSYPRNFDFDVINEINKLQKQKRAYEVHLQLYFIENIGVDSRLNPIVGNNVVWFGNEVGCGVGMQKIDILTICKSKDRVEYRIIELKDEPVQPKVVDQIEYYVNWASEEEGRHLKDAFRWNIQPVIVAPRGLNNSSVFDAFRDYNKRGISLPLLYFEFEILPSNIIFKRIDY